MKLFHLIGRESTAKLLISLKALSLHKVKFAIQIEPVPKNLLNHGRRNTSTLYLLEMATDSLMGMAADFLMEMVADSLMGITMTAKITMSLQKRGNGVKDGIDWSIKDKEVERLKAKVLPVYWESLLDTPNSAIRVTERLYVLRDWDHLGNLTVTLQYIRLTSLGAAVQVCLQDDWQI